MRKDVFYIVLMLIITDLVILADINYLRQIIPFIFFNIIPGFLLLGILKSDELKFLERFILSVGLSISLIMFTGLIINSLYPLIEKPLSFLPIIVSLNVLVLVLITIFYFRVKKLDLKFNFNVKKGILSPMIFSFIFPMITILGSFLMDFYSNNTILLATLLLIPVYLIILAILNKNLHPATYPLAIFNISLALLLMNSLPSNYLIGRDIHREYYFFRLAIQNNYWDMSLPHAYNSCISVTILPAIYNQLLNTFPINIFKVYYSVIGAFIPLGVYLISERVLKNKSLAFYATLLFIFQFSFIYISGWARQLIALLFFTLAIMTITSSSLKEYVKKTLFIIFVLSTVFSHYTTSYIFLIIIILIPIMLLFIDNLNQIAEKYYNSATIAIKKITKRFDSSKKSVSFTSLTLALIFMVVVFTWYAMATGQTFNDFILFINNTFSSMTYFFAEDMRNNPELAVMGVGIAEIPNLISVIIHNTIFIIIGIGSLVLLLKTNLKEYRINREYLLAILISLVMLAGFIILPFLSKGYGGTRLFTQLLVILAPLFIIGIKSITKFLKKSNLNIPLILTLLIVLFSCTNYMQYHFYGIPYSYSYDVDSERRYETYIYDSEVVGARWLNNYANKDVQIYSDAAGTSRILLGFDEDPWINTKFFSENKTLQRGYVYLRYVNINKGLIFIELPTSPPTSINGTLKFDNVEKFNDLDQILEPYHIIYSNGGTKLSFI